MKYLRVFIIPIIIIIGIILYKLPIFESWRQFNHAVTAFKENNFKSAAASFKKVLDHYDDHQLYYNYGISDFSFARSEINAARKKFDTTADPKEIEKIDSLAFNTVQSLNRLIVDQATKLKPDELSTLNYVKGLLHLELEQKGEAQTCFLEALKHDKKQEHVLLEIARLEAENDSSYVTRLLLAEAESYPVNIIEGWKPF
ncbi:hypothetical protein JXB12_11640 [candidate division KSB1 bacterium]|nr:hypothetical protein [candidate division KSB1 bacterium]